MTEIVIQLGLKIGLVSPFCPPLFHITKRKVSVGSRHAWTMVLAARARRLYFSLLPPHCVYCVFFPKYYYVLQEKEIMNINVWSIRESSE